MSKVTLKELLVQKEIAETIDEAVRMIMAGEVEVEGLNKNALKPGTLIDEGAAIKLVKRRRFVSRGGEKLDYALTRFDIEVKDRVCCDVGTSTGGFTDCLLQYGARKIYAIDTGYGKIHYALRNEERVVLFERTNFKYFDFSNFSERVELFVVDVSFISVVQILKKIKEYCEVTSAVETIALIKPQFEAKPHMLRKGILQQQYLSSVVEKVLEEIRQLGFNAVDMVESPIKGTKGNIEYLVYLRCG